MHINKSCKRKKNDDRFFFLKTFAFKKLIFLVKTETATLNNDPFINFHC